jgi:hypothetical protein
MNKPHTNNMIARNKNTPNKTLAISRAEPAIFVNPSIAAMIEITRNMAAHFNMANSFP